MTTPPVSKAALAWLVVSQLGYMLSLLPWLAMAGLSVMAFDTPGSTANWQPWLLVSMIWSYPIIALGCSVAAWVFFARKRGTAACIATSAPLLLIVPFLLLLVS